MKTITHDDYLRLVGLLTLAADQRKLLDALERSACALTGDTTRAGSHTSDAVWIGDPMSPERLLELLSITVTPSPALTVVSWSEVEAAVGQSESGSELTELDPRWG